MRFTDAIRPDLQRGMPVPLSQPRPGAIGRIVPRRRLTEDFSNPGRTRPAVRRPMI